MNKETERVDLVDKHGKVQKKGVLRSEVDQYPDLHMQIVIMAVFDKQNRLLVQRRAVTKKTCPGDIDLVCGAVMSEESPEIAAAREAIEETGLIPKNLRIVQSGINTYNRYRYLLAGEAEGEPGEFDPKEVEWVRFIDPKELKTKQQTGEFSFVDEFFDDLELVVSFGTTD